jgi:hypothetical protein
MTTTITGATGINRVADGADMPAGSVIQVVQGVDNARVTISATSYTGGLVSANITPSSASSKILVHLNFGGNDNTTGDISAYITIYRDSTNIGHSSHGFAKMRSTNSRVESMGSIMYLDSPSTGSAITYSMYAKVSSGAFEFPGAPGMPTIITLMEIAQ